jgi:hypothetical protein
MSHNLITEIKKKLTWITIVKQLAFHCDKTSKIKVSISLLPQRQERSVSLPQIPISIWYLAGGYMPG